MVGCVLVRDDAVVAEGFHGRFGGPHAEIEALRRAGKHASGATAFVTLEPCCHHGKTPPCTDALIEAGVARVVAAMADPFPEVAGRGVKRLREAGIRVSVGLCEGEAAELNAPYLTLIRHQRPYVILKWAQSLDGKLATRTGDSRWISSPAARQMAHRLRARVDGVLVGIRTALADDPLLTARDVPVLRTATRIVLDTHLRLPLECQLVATARTAPVLVMTSEEAARLRTRHVEQLVHHGVAVEGCAVKREQLDLTDVLSCLGRRRMTNLMVEGGGQVLSDFLDSHLADEVYAFVAPKLIGGQQAVPAYGGLGIARLEAGTPVRTARISRIGPDTMFHLRLAAREG